ncbi:MAG: hypothetical protein ACI4SH_02555, partial [Candidatus Scatosoma sp.]
RGEKYVFPLNEPEHGNHCHGELYRTAAEIVRLSESEAAFRFVSDPSRPYLGFPHPCALTLTYALSARGLSQILRIQNFDSRPMPFAAAFHTTFNLAFEGGDVGEYSLYMPVKREFLREMKNYLPTGETDDNFKEKKPLNEGVWKPSENAITKFTEVYAAGCEIIHNTSGNRVAYTADPLYKYRHIFNGGSREFICIEPQTCRIDGLNVWKNEDVGIVEVAAGAEISLHSNIRLITEALREGNGA